MEKVFIRVRTKEGDIFISDQNEMSEDEISQLEKMIMKAVEGELKGFSFTKGKQKKFFGSELLKTSVVSIYTV